MAHLPTNPPPGSRRASWCLLATVLLLGWVGLYICCSTKDRKALPTAPQDLYSVVAVLLPKDGSYNLTEHFVTTADGYVLRLFRLLHARAHPEPRPVVYLQHALLDSAAGWVIMGEDNSLACLLAREGYDVWMGNVRGNRFSRNHTSLSPDSDPAFWDYSWDEHALQDLPASINYTLAVTGAKTLQLVGYSQGTTMTLAALSTLPYLAQRISVAVLMAPVSFTGHITSPLFVAMSAVGTAGFLEHFGISEFGTHNEEEAAISSRFCGAFPYACVKWLQLLCGANPQPGANIDNSLLPLIMHYLPYGTSTRNMDHWSQGVRSSASGPQGLKMYDWGSDCPPVQQPPADLAPPKTSGSASTTGHLGDDPLSHTATSNHTARVSASAQKQNEQEQQQQQAGITGAPSASLPKEEAAYRLARRLLSQQSGQHWRATGTCNQIKYGTTEPPAYDFSRITTPLALFTGGHDSLADPVDLELLLEALPSHILAYHSHLDDYAHLDFGLGADAGVRLYPDIARILKQHLPQ